jgi:hypothetical protein
VPHAEQLLAAEAEKEGEKPAVLASGHSKRDDSGRKKWATVEVCVQTILVVFKKKKKSTQ